MATDLKDLQFCLTEFNVHVNEVIGFTTRKVNFQGQMISKDSEWQQWLKPHEKLSGGVMRYFNLSPEKLNANPSIREIDSRWLAWTEGTVLVNSLSAYEIYSLMKTRADAHLPPQSVPVLDPFYMARYLHPKTWEDTAETLKQTRHKPNGLQVLSEITFSLMKEFQKRGIKSLETILPYSCPKSVSRAYSPLHQVLMDALLRKVSIVIEYPQRSDPGPQGGAQGAPHRRTANYDRRKVDIYGFRAPFLVGFCHMRKAMRTFRIERIRRIQVLEESHFDVPDSFSLGEYFMGLHPTAREADLTKNIHFN